jgi:predicted MPP superfamily phosphohydrolase
MSMKKRVGVVLSLLVAIGVFLGLYAFVIEPNRLVVNSYEIKIDEATSAIDGLKIVAISDLHGGANFIDSAKLEFVAKTVNAQKPDIVFILGDFVSQTGAPVPISGRDLNMPMSQIADSISTIEAKYGVFAVIGNHDDWYDRTKVREELERVNIKVLVDELADVEINGSKLYLLGLRDFMSSGPPLEFRENARALVQNVTDGDLIILDHSPDITPIFAGPGMISDRTRIIFAGHTHGGQVWFPFAGSMIVPSNYGQTFSSGSVVYGGLNVFVTTGIGTSILPVRFMVPPEIAVVTIRKS